MNRCTNGFICILVLAGILACQLGTTTQTSLSTATITPTATATSTNIPTVTPILTLPSMIYDGEWEGLTELGLPVSFRVEDNVVTHFAAEIDTEDCHLEVEPDLAGFGAIENGSFSITVGNPLLGYRWHFEGTFISSSKATGEFSAFLGRCGSANTTWEASRE